MMSLFSSPNRRSSPLPPLIKSLPLLPLNMSFSPPPYKLSSPEEASNILPLLLPRNSSFLAVPVGIADTPSMVFSTELGWFKLG